MGLENPLNCTVQDLCTEALYESGAFGRGQSFGTTDLVGAQARLTLMMNEWFQKRWMVYHLVDMGIVSTGADEYSVGPGGDFNTGADQGGWPVSQRPGQIEAAFLRMTGSGSGPFNDQFNDQFDTGPANASLPVDYYMQKIESYEEYARIRVKQLRAFPGWFFYDSGYPLGRLLAYPIAQADIYELHILVRAQLPPAWANSGTRILLPFEYYSAMLYNLAVRLRSRYTILTWPGDSLPGLAKNALATVRGPNTQIGQLRMPSALLHSDGYNIFTDSP